MRGIRAVLDLVVHHVEPDGEQEGVDETEEDDRRQYVTALQSLRYAIGRS
jgi:hypothetical protein